MGITATDRHSESASLRSVQRERADIRTPVTLLTGFLGSGKTTLLNRAMSAPSLTNTLVIINEFGAVSLDHALVTSSDDTITVLANGCLCCTVFGDLVGTLNRLYHQREAGELPPFDHVLIETSGLADPRPVLQAFLSDPTLEGLYRVAAVIAVVDAVNAADTFDAHAEASRQVALADTILISKLDLLPAGSAATRESQLCARLRALNPAATVARVDAASVEPEQLLRRCQPLPGGDATQTRAWLNEQAYEQPPHAHGARHGADHGHEHRDSVSSFCFVREQPLHREALQLLLNALEQNLGPNLLRVKGLVNVIEEPGQPAVIQGAQHLLHNLTWLPRWPDADQRTRIVFITDGIDRSELESMIALLDRVATRTAVARQAAANRPTA
jgi:G3E family GTPase